MKDKARLGTAGLLAGFALLVSAVFVGPACAAESASDAVVSVSVHVALLDKLGVDSLHVSVNTHEGHVQLAGTVAKRETRELATSIAKSVGGVASVQNDIRTRKDVTGSDKATVVANEGEREVKDTLLAGRVRLQLMNRMGSDSFKVHPRVADHVVMLSFSDELGAADRAKAVELAKGVESVKKVIVLSGN